MGNDLRNEIYRRKWSPKKQSGPVSIHAGPFDLHDAVRIITQIALGMACQPYRNVAHRDLNSANVLVSEHHSSIDVKIGGFDESETTVSREICWGPPWTKAGTGFWRAPEVFSEERRPYDLKAADVYSFAMTCYEILTGLHPFDGMDRGYSSYRALQDEVIRGLRPELPNDQSLIPAVRLVSAY